MIVRELRLKKGLSQEQLAEMAGISTRTLQRIERGSNASAETLKCIASVLETDFKTLREAQSMSSETRTPDADPYPMSEDDGEAEEEALQYVKDVKSFYSHAGQYVVVMFGLLVLNLLTSPGNLWVIWPALGWGIGLMAHGLSVFELVDLFGEDWEEDQVRDRLQRR